MKILLSIMLVFLISCAQGGGGKVNNKNDGDVDSSFDVKLAVEDFTSNNFMLVGKTYSVNVNIKNNGSTVTNGSLRFSSNKSQVKINGSNCSNVSPGNSCEVRLHVRLTTEGSFSGKITVENNGNEDEILITAFGVSDLRLNSMIDYIKNNQQTNGSMTSNYSMVNDFYIVQAMKEYNELKGYSVFNSTYFSDFKDYITKIDDGGLRDIDFDIDRNLLNTEWTYSRQDTSIGLYVKEVIPSLFYIKKELNEQLGVEDNDSVNEFNDYLQSLEMSNQNYNRANYFYIFDEDKYSPTAYSLESNLREALLLRKSVLKFGESLEDFAYNVYLHNNFTSNNLKNLDENGNPLSADIFDPAIELNYNQEKFNYSNYIDMNISETLENKPNSCRDQAYQTILLSRIYKDREWVGSEKTILDNNLQDSYDLLASYQNSVTNEFEEECLPLVITALSLKPEFVETSLSMDNLIIELTIFIDDGDYAILNDSLIYSEILQMYSEILKEKNI